MSSCDLTSQYVCLLNHPSPVGILNPEDERARHRRFPNKEYVYALERERSLRQCSVVFYEFDGIDLRSQRRPLESFPKLAGQQVSSFATSTRDRSRGAHELSIR